LTIIFYALIKYYVGANEKGSLDGCKCDKFGIE